MTSLLTIKQQSTSHEFSDFIRRQGNISWWQEDGFWLVSSYAIAKEVLKDPRFSANRTAFFRQQTQRLGLPMIPHFFQLVNKMMVVDDEPDHQPKRKICAHGINHYFRNNLTQRVNFYLDHYLDELGDTDSFDLVRHIAEQLPGDVMSDMLTLPKEEKKAFFSASLAMNMFFGGANEYLTLEGSEQVDAHSRFLRQRFAQLVAEKRQNLGDDFISLLLKHQHAYQLSDDDILSQLVMVLNAGLISLTDQLCNSFYQIFQDAALVKKLSQQPDLIEMAVVEGTRLDPTVSFTFRVATTDFLFHGCPVKEGDSIFISNHAVNRDPQVFPHPHLIHPDNSSINHFSFSYGAHYCIGYRMAMLEMCETLKKIVAKWGPMSVDNQRTLRRHDSLAFSGFDALWLEPSCVD